MFGEKEKRQRCSPTPFSCYKQCDEDFGNLYIPYDVRMETTPFHVINVGGLNHVTTAMVNH